MGQGNKAGIFLAAVAAALCLGGCARETEWTPSESSVIIGESGGVTELIMETLDKDYYSSQELQQMVNASVDEYNQKNGGGAVTVSEFGAEGREAKLTIEYRSAEDFLAFNGGSFYNGSMLGAEMAGYTLETPFYAVKNGSVSSKQLDSDEVKQHKEYSVLVLEGPREFSIPTNVLFVSGNVEMINKNCGRVLTETVAQEEPEEETKAGLVLPSNRVYTGGKVEDAEAKQPEETLSYAYIIYE